MTNRAKGTLALVASAFGFAVMGMCVHWADLHGAYLSSFQKSFFRNLVAVVVAAAFFCRGSAHAAGVRTVRGLPPKSLRLLLLRSLFGTVGIFANFYALSHIPLGDAQTLNKLSPFCAVLFSWLFIRERITLRQGLCITGAFLGAMLVVKPGFSGALWPALCGLAGGISAGAAYACVRELGILKVDSKLIVLFFSAFSTLASVPFLVFSFQPMTGAQLAILFGAGLGATAGQFGVTAAYRFAPPREIAAWDYTNILFSAFLGYVMFGQIPDLLSWLGFAVIVVMALALKRTPARAAVALAAFACCIGRAEAAGKEPWRSAFDGLLSSPFSNPEVKAQDRAHA